MIPAGVADLEVVATAVADHGGDLTAQADAERTEACQDAVAFLATTTLGRQGRRRMVARLVTASVYVQAGLLGLVACSRCGDLGCDWCRAGIQSW